MLTESNERKRLHYYVKPKTKIKLRKYHSLAVIKSENSLQEENVRKPTYCPHPQPDADKRNHSIQGRSFREGRDKMKENIQPNKRQIQSDYESEEVKQSFNMLDT